MPDPSARSPEAIAARAQRRRKAWSIASAAGLLLLVALCGTFFEDFKKWFPWLTELQLRSYNAVSRLEARRPRPKFVAPVEIDDATFYDTMHLGSGDVTDRHSLAKMIRTIACFHPAVIALDITLVKQPPDDYAPRNRANRDLLSAICEAHGKSIPVVLTRRVTGGKVRQNIFEDEALPGFDNSKDPYRARVGFDNAAEELRKIPLRIWAQSLNGTICPYNSFALQAAEAYEDSLGINPRTSDRLDAEITQGRFVYTTFLRQEEFLPVSGNAVLHRDSSQLQKLNHRIVLIGGNRHDRSAGENVFLDDHYLPPYHMRGMYFQANYIEGLLDDRIRTTVPDLVAFSIDLLLGAALIYFSRKGDTSKARLLLLAIFFIPVLFAYVAAINLGYVLDFVLPLLLLFLHIGIDHYIHLRHLAHHKEFTQNGKESAQNGKESTQNA